MSKAAEWAQYLAEAASRRRAVAPITGSEPDLTIADAYDIQDELVHLHLAQGEAIVGVKIGLTSHAKQQEMGIDEPVYGVLTNGMSLGLEQPLVLDELIHPRVEPEIVFTLGDDLAGPGLTGQDVLDATATVCCGLEVIDSRYVDFRFTLPDVVADNTSASRFVLGPMRMRPDFDLSLVGCLFEVDGRLVSTAAGAAVLGHPAEAVARLGNWMGRRGRRLQAGWRVLSGGLTSASPLTRGRHVVATFSKLGHVGLRAV